MSFLSRPEVPFGISVVIMGLTLIFLPLPKKTDSASASVSAPMPPSVATPTPVPSSTVAAAASAEPPDAGVTTTTTTTTTPDDAPISPATARAFHAAKALFDTGRYADAIPKFDAIASQHPEAELYAARAVVQMKSCYAASKRYDAFVARNAGTERAGRAALELARCYRDQGVHDAARKRLEKLTEDRFVGADAKRDLEKMNAPVRARPARAPATPAASSAPTPSDPPPDTP